MTHISRKHLWTLQRNVKVKFYESFNFILDPDADPNYHHNLMTSELDQV